MAVPGQRFQLDLDADEFTINPLDENEVLERDPSFAVKEIRERDSELPPTAPSLKASKSGFPEHRPRRDASAFKKRQQAAKVAAKPAGLRQAEPSDRAIINQLGKTHGIDFEKQQKADISAENKRRVAQMSVEDVEEARAELMKNFSPAFLNRMLKRANIDDNQGQDDAAWSTGARPSADIPAFPRSPDHDSEPDSSAQIPPPTPKQTAAAAAIHFPAPPRSRDDYVPLDAEDPAFLSNLKSNYFPNLSHDPSALKWLQDPTDEENQDSLYNPEKDSYLASALRFGFNGRLIPPKESLEIDVKHGLHHHGDAPSSAGYTIPELTMLSRSTLPNQRCIAYQTLGRILYRLGRGDFGSRGSELHEALWSVIEKEKPIEVMMGEANRQSGHASAAAYATEALWLWRKGGGGDRGVLKPNQKLAK